MNKKIPKCLHQGALLLGGVMVSGFSYADLGPNLSLDAGADGSSKGSGTSYGNVIDGDLSTYWQPSSTSGERIGVKNTNSTFNTVVIRELNNATTSWRLTDHDSGEVLASGSSLGAERVISGFGDRSLYKVNLMIDGASSAPQIAEFEVYNATDDGTSSSSSSSSSSSESSSSSSAGGGTDTVVLQEGNTGFCSVDGAVESEHAGYTGSGFANVDNDAGTGVVWSVYAGASDTYTLQWRYANGGSDRPGEVFVNGGSQGVINMPATGGWTNYTESGTFTVNLQEGYNEIRLEGTSGESLANIDFMSVTGVDAAAAECGGASSSSSSSSSVSSSSSESSSSSSDAGIPGNANGLIGFATLDEYGRNGTNGGEGGEVVTVSNYAELAAAVSDNTPRIVQVSGTIYSDGDDMLRVGSNKTIIGADSGATIDGFGFNISGWGSEQVNAMGSTCDADEYGTFTPANNVIVQNLTFVNSSDDSINLQCWTHHVWINYNTFHSSDDGSVDIKRGSDLVTVSRNHFIDTSKTMLLGHSESNGDQDRGRLRVTYHDNFFDGTETRQPRVRFGYAHVFNNYYDSSNYLLGLGIEATIYAEGNYVERTKTITEQFGSDYHLTWTDTNYYDEATIGRANDSGKTKEDWLDADQSVAPPNYEYTAYQASAMPPMAGAGNMPDDDGSSSSSSDSSSSASSDPSSSSSESSSSSSETSSSVSSSSSSSVSSSSSSSSSYSGNPGDVLSCEMANTVQGFAAMGNGTTGGAGGDEVTVSNGYELEAALDAKRDSSIPLTIYVDGTISPSNSDVSKFDVKDMNDVSIIGVGNNAMFDGIGIKIWRANNVIVRNVTMRYVRIGDKDHITIDGPSSNIWIDHNTFYNSLDVDKDYYDELVSGKGDIDNITVSYNVMRDSWKTSLWGSGDGDSSHRRVTFLGNYWKDANSRLPLFRFGEGHVVNNYYDGVISTGINSRMGATLSIEGNVFENAHNPIVAYYSSDVGYWDVEDNIYTNVTWEANPDDGIEAGPDVQDTVSYTPPYGYSRLPAADAKAHVLANAGAGVVVDCLDAPISGGGSSSSYSSSSSSYSSSEPTSSSSSSTSGDPGELGSNLALGAGADGSSKGDGSYGNVVDGDMTSYWQPSGTSGERIGVKNVGSTFNTVIIRELNDATTSWRLTDHDTGEVLAQGSTLGSEAIITGFGDINIYKVNLMIDSANTAPRIAEFEVYNASGDVSGGDSSSSVASSSSSSSSSSSFSGEPVVPTSEMQGFALLNGGTTGGEGGEVVTVSNYSDLVAAVSDDTPRVVRISGTISGDGSDMLKVRSNKTIIGEGSNAVINGFGFDLNGWTSDLVDQHGSTCDPEYEHLITPVNNVIIRNLTFRNSGDDSINMQCYTHNVWVDHNTFEKSDDGSVDVKRGSDWVTVSWNHFVQTDKTMLLGHDDGNGEQDEGRLHVTYHHNWFDHTEQRHPRIRFGQAHVYNNFANQIGEYFVGLGDGASVHADGNYVDYVKRTSKDYGGTEMTWDDTNIVEDSMHYGIDNGTGFDPSWYYSYQLDNAADVPALVQQYSGAGKL